MINQYALKVMAKQYQLMLPCQTQRRSFAPIFNFLSVRFVAVYNTGQAAFDCYQQTNWFIRLKSACTSNGSGRGFSCIQGVLAMVVKSMSTLLIVVASRYRSPLWRNCTIIVCFRVLSVGFRKINV